MEQRKRLKAIHGEIYLHEAIIQHIQSFLSSKEAAQTSLLCKTWYNAWATRPVVDLDQRHFQIHGGADTVPPIAVDFLEYSKKIVRRYKESNLNIESFRFCMESIEVYYFPIVNELVVVAMKLGACDLNVEVLKGAPKFDLPHEVLRSENLVRLSVRGCRIDFGATGGKVCFSKLKSLSLRRVCIVGIPSLDIVSYCPSIEELVLSDCFCICTVRIGDIKLEDRVRSRNDDTVEITRDLVEFDAPIQPYNNLKCLYLERILIDELLVNNISTSFPCLKDSTLIYCSVLDEVLIFIPSLEFLRITGTVNVMFDVPRLRKFTFSDITIPDLWFEDSPREWESDISITCMLDSITITSWLDTLKNFLMKLSSSKISLSLCIWIRTIKGFDLVEHFPSLPIPEVENLMLSICDTRISVCSKLLKSVFSTCRPKFITYGLVPEFCIEWKEISDMLSLFHKTLTRKGSKGCCNPRRHMFDKYGLEKVNVEVFEDQLSEWRPLPWMALVDASESHGTKQKIRFKLEWGQNPFIH